MMRSTEREKHIHTYRLRWVIFCCFKLLISLMRFVCFKFCLLCSKSELGLSLREAAPWSNSLPKKFEKDIQNCSSFAKEPSPVGWGCRIHRLPLCRRVLDIAQSNLSVRLL